MSLPCVILAGGLGTRMRPQTEFIPKALIAVRGIPFVDLQLRRLAEAGISEVIYSIGYRGQMLRDHVGAGAEHGLKVEYVDEDDALRGTAGALRFALSQGRLPESFHVLYGDSYLTLDFARVEAAWQSSGLPAQMTVLHNRGNWDRSNVVFKSGKVVLYEPDSNRTHDDMDWIDYGLSTLTAEVVRRMIPTESAVQLPALWARLSVSGQLGGFEIEERFYEVGSSQGLHDLEEYLARDQAAGPAGPP